MRSWGRTLVRLNPLWSVAIDGLERIDPRATYVVTSNHQSNADVIVLSYLSLLYVYMSKRAIFRIPVMGWGMRAAGCIPLERGDKTSARAAMALAAERLRRGVSLLIFPEGTRSRDGQVGPFKDGAFRLAIQTGRPILPVVVDGSRTVLPKGTWLLTQKTRVRVVVLEPVPTQGLEERQAAEIMTRVRERIVAKLAEMRGERG
jgi:1-acyl-sn-glycerol-3-phosphate acyltransferase